MGYTTTHFENDTSWVRLSKLKDDAIKIELYFQKCLECSVYDLELSGFYALKCFELSKKLNNNKGIIQASDLLGNFYMQKGNYRLAYKWMNYSIRLKEKLNDHFGLAISYNQLSIIFRLMKNYKAAEENARNSIRESILLGNSRFIAFSSSTLSNIFYEEKLMDSAILYSQRVLELHRKHGDSSGIGLILSNQATMYIDKKEFDMAIELAQEALNYVPKSNKRLILITQTSLANAFLSKNKLNEAEKCFMIVFSNLNEFNEADQRAEIYRVYSELLLKKRKFEEALAFRMRYEQLNDSLISAQNNSEISRLETEFQFDKKENENALLIANRKADKIEIEKKGRETKSLIIILLVSVILLLIIVLFFVNKSKTAAKLAEQNERIQKQNTTLKELNALLIVSEENLKISNETKEELLSIISHDLSGPVRAIANYNSAIVNRIDNMSRTELHAGISTLNENMNNLQILTDNILEFALTQRNEFTVKNEELKLLNELSDCIKIFEASVKTKNIIIDCLINSSVFIYTDRNVFHIIVRNLLSNAIKYSKANSLIKIEFNALTKTLSFVDFGLGMDEQQIAAILEGSTPNSRNGTANEKGAGLGMKLVNNCLKLTNAKLLIQSIPNSGTTFTIKF